MPDAPLFLYDLSSPYAYLAAARIDDLVPDARWTPISFGVLIRAIGKTPWSMRPGREPEMEAIDARARSRGLPPIAWPQGWPVDTYSLTPLRAALVAGRSGRLREFTMAAFAVQFAEGRSLAELDNVLAAARSAGIAEDDVRAGIVREDVKDQLRANTDDAIRRGVSGVPSLVVGDRIVHGDDRLEEAAGLHRARGLA